MGHVSCFSKRLTGLCCPNSCKAVQTRNRFTPTHASQIPLKRLYITYQAVFACDHPYEAMGETGSGRGRPQSEVEFGRVGRLLTLKACTPANKPTIAARTGPLNFMVSSLEQLRPNFPAGPHKRLSTERVMKIPRGIQQQYTCFRS